MGLGGEVAAELGDAARSVHIEQHQPARAGADLVSRRVPGDDPVRPAPDRGLRRVGRPDVDLQGAPPAERDGVRVEADAAPELRRSNGPIG